MLNIQCSPISIKRSRTERDKRFGSAKFQTETLPPNRLTTLPSRYTPNVASASERREENDAYLDRRAHARELSAAANERGEPLSWFEDIYAEAARDGLEVLPWAGLRPNLNLVEWLDREQVDGSGLRALVVGCGLGDDAEELSRRGFQTTAFDLSPTAVSLAKQRFPETRVDYRTANLLEPPANWRRGFDFVFEAYTLQAMPQELRSDALGSVASLVAPGGRLLVIARAREEDETSEGVPFPLSRGDLNRIVEAGLAEVRLEDCMDEYKDPPVRRFRALYRRDS